MDSTFLFFIEKGQSPIPTELLILVLILNYKKVNKKEKFRNICVDEKTNNDIYEMLLSSQPDVFILGMHQIIDSVKNNNFMLISDKNIYDYLCYNLQYNKQNKELILEALMLSVTKENPFLCDLITDKLINILYNILLKKKSDWMVFRMILRIFSRIGNLKVGFLENCFKKDNNINEGSLVNFIIKKINFCFDNVNEETANGIIGGFRFFVALYCNYDNLSDENFKTFLESNQCLNLIINSFRELSKIQSFFKYCTKYFYLCSFDQNIDLTIKFYNLLTTDELLDMIRIHKTRTDEMFYLLSIIRNYVDTNDLFLINNSKNILDYWPSTKWGTSELSQYLHIFFSIVISSEQNCNQNPIIIIKIFELINNNLVSYKITELFFIGILNIICKFGTYSLLFFIDLFNFHNYNFIETIIIFILENTNHKHEDLLIKAFTLISNFAKIFTEQNHLRTIDIIFSEFRDDFNDNQFLQTLYNIFKS